MSFDVRVADPSAYEDVVRLRTERVPRLPRANAAWLFEHAAEMELLDVRTVYVDGVLVAAGSASRGRWYPPDMAIVGVTVARSHERRGIGTALHRTLLDALPGTIVRIGAMVDDEDPESLEIALAHGYEVAQHGIESELALVDLPEPDAPPGVVFEDISSFELADETAVEAMLVDSQTNPEAGEGFLSRLAHFRELAAGSPHPLAVLARLDGAPAAIIVGDVRDGVLDIAYTGVGRAFRGRNIGFALKQFAHLVAADAGATLSRTTNEESNAGIRHVNRRLGYQVVRGGYRLRATRR